MNHLINVKKIHPLFVRPCGHDRFVVRTAEMWMSEDGVLVPYARTLASNKYINACICIYIYISCPQGRTNNGSTF